MSLSKHIAYIEIQKHMESIKHVEFYMKSFQQEKYQKLEEEKEQLKKEAKKMKNIKEDEKLSVLNHSCAHLLAQAVKHLYNDAKFWVGPVIEEGFYYDIDLNGKTLTEEDLPVIEKEMKKIAKDGKRIVRHELTKEEALEKFKDDRTSSKQ